jgi:succinyl-CoA synthetase beta subunit
MKLYEYMAKGIFKKHGIPVPEGYVIESPDEIRPFEGDIVLKSQVLVGGRGKAGGIKFASNMEEAKKLSAELLGMDIKGYKVRKLLIEPKIKILKEYYMSIIVDRSSREAMLIASKEGGVEIESVPDEKIFKRTINPLIGVQPNLIRALSYALGLDKEQSKDMARFVYGLWDAFTKEDADLAEINPLVLTPEGFMAADAKFIINEDSMFRHKDVELVEEEYTPLEREAREKGIAFVQLDGNIGVIANGAGLTMATLDVLSLYGGKAGTFLDLGGTDDQEKVSEAFGIISEAPIDVVFLNIFGGITKCDTVANGVVKAIEKKPLKVPIVARLKG